MAYNPAAITEFKDGSTPSTGTLALGSLFEAEFDQLYGNWNHFFGAAGTTLTVDNITAGQVSIGGNYADEILEVVGTSIMDGSNPISIQIRDLRSGSSWTTGAESTVLKFWGSDTSGIGSAVKGKIAMTYENVNGSYMAMRFHVASSSSLDEMMSLRYTGLYVGGEGVASNLLHVQSTATPQVRFAYDASNYLTISVGSNGGTAIANTGTGDINFTPAGGDVQVLAGNNFRIMNTGNTKNISLNHDDTNGILDVSSGSLTIPVTVNSSSSTTGALIIGSGGNGGLGVAEDIYAGADIHAGGSLYVASNLAVTGNYTLPLKVTDATASSSKDTGCAIFEGGIGVEEDVYAGGQINCVGSIGTTTGNIVATAGTIIASAGNIQATAGYFKSGKGRWPTDNFHANSDDNAIFDAMDAYIPNDNDEMLVTGAIVSGGSTYIASRAVRYSSTRIYLYVCTAAGGAAIRNIDDGGSTAYNGSLAW